MEKSQKVILSIIVLVVLILLFLIIGIFVLMNKKDEIIDPSKEKYDIIDEIELKVSIEPVEVRNNFYSVRSCTNKFFSYYIDLFNIEEDYIVEDTIQEVKSKNAEALYNILDEEFIVAKSITKDNILTKLSKINKSEVSITEMYVSEKTNNISIYIVKGTLLERISSNISQFQIIVKVDSFNKTFSIIPQSYVLDKYKDLKIGDNIEIEVPDSIEKNENNTYDFRNISDETYVMDLFNKYKKEILYNQELAYEILDEDYKNKRFGTLENFKEYAKNNVSKNVTMKLKGYKKTTTEYYTQYTCIDQNGSYYIFRETLPMKYTLILDTHTIDLPEYIEKYDNGNDKTKVELNIGKFIEALNTKDYQYIYNHLDEQFRNNNYRTVNDLKNYIELNFYDQNTISLNKYSEQNGIYIYDLILKNTKNEIDTKSLKVVLKLEDNRDFAMSFSM